MRYRDLKGERFGRLTCLKVAGKDDVSRCMLWLCECECGNQATVKSSSLRNGNTQSCGCFQREVAVRDGKRRIKHGLTRDGGQHQVYKCWYHMKNRCLNPNDKSYYRYGGRGIRICDEWLDFEAFYSWATNNGFQPGLSIERMDYNGDYEPANCCWASAKVQNNNKSSNIRISFKGENRTLSEWSETLGMSYSALHQRLNSGWSVDQAFTTPIRRRA